MPKYLRFKSIFKDSIVDSFETPRVDRSLPLITACAFKQVQIEDFVSQSSIDRFSPFKNSEKG